MNVLIVDNEPPARAELRRLLETVEDVTVIGECANAVEGISAINDEIIRATNNTS